MGYYDLMYNATKYDEIGCDFCLVKKIGLDNIYKEIDYHIFYANKIVDNLLNQKLCYRLDNDGSRKERRRKCKREVLDVYPCCEHLSGGQRRVMASW